MTSVVQTIRHVTLLSCCVVLAVFVPATEALARELPDFTVLVEKNSPAVVNVSTVQKANSKRDTGNPEMDEFFRRFFGPDGRGAPFGPDQRGAPFSPRRSLGSGFIISADGYILTNNHVVEDADEIIVRMSDRRELEARLVGADPRSDLALLKVEADDLPVVKLGHSANLKVG